MDNLTTYFVGGNKVTASTLANLNLRSAQTGVTHKASTLKLDAAIALMDESLFIQAAPIFVKGMTFTISGITALERTTTAAYKGQPLRNKNAAYFIVDVLGESGEKLSQILAPTHMLVDSIPTSPKWRADGSEDNDPDTVNDIITKFSNASDLQIAITDTAEQRLGAVLGKTFTVRDLHRLRYYSVDKPESKLSRSLLDLQVVN